MPRSKLAILLRARNKLIEQAALTGYNQQEVLVKLYKISQKIELEERKGSRIYLDHVMENK